MCIRDRLIHRLAVVLMEQRIVALQMDVKLLFECVEGEPKGLGVLPAIPFRHQVPRFRSDLTATTTNLSETLRPGRRRSHVDALAYGQYARQQKRERDTRRGHRRHVGVSAVDHIHPNMGCLFGRRNHVSKIVEPSNLFSLFKGYAVTAVLGQFSLTHFLNFAHAAAYPSSILESEMTSSPCTKTACMPRSTSPA